MRIFFIYPNIKGQIGFNYGIASLSAVLKAKGHETSLLNLNEKLSPIPDFDTIAETIAAYGPDVIGFSVVSTQFEYARRLAGRLRETCKAPIVMGGVHATMVPGDVAALPEFDYVCVGEAEASFPELVEALETGGDTTAIPGVWTAREGEVIANPVRPLPDLASLPRKDYALFDFQAMIDAKDGWVGLMASRGCPYRCTYCFNHEMFQRYMTDLAVPAAKVNYVRHHPVEAVIEEIQHLLSTYERIRMFIFDDDLFTHDKAYLLDFCMRYPKISTVPLTVNAHVLRFDDEIAAALKTAGCRLVKFGIESGSPRIRKEIMNRHMSNEAIVSAFATARRAGLETSAFLMFGLPHEGPAEVRETIELLAQARPTRLRWSIFYPFPGTRAHRIALEGGFLDREKMRSLQNFFEESALDFGPEQNRRIQRLRRTLPWEVNAAADAEGRRIYGPLLELCDGIPDDAWERWQGNFPALDGALSALLDTAGRPHYRIRYNEFMAVFDSGS